MIRFSVTVDNAQVLDRAFNRVEHVLSDMRPVWSGVPAVFYAIEAEQFESEGAAGAAGRFTKLTPAYEKFKELAFPGQTILRATGHLEESLTSIDAPDAVFISDPDQLTLGTKTEYALAHQRGTSRMPARPPISLSEQQKRRVQKAIQQQLVRLTREAGFTVIEEAA